MLPGEEEQSLGCLHEHDGAAFMQAGSLPKFRWHHEAAAVAH